MSLSAQIISDAEALRAASILQPLFLARQRFTALIEGPAFSGRTAVLAAAAVAAGEAWNCETRHFAFIGPDPAAAHYLMRVLADLVEPGCAIEPLFDEDRAGGLVDICYAHSGQFERVSWQDRQRFLDQFLAQQARAGADLSNERKWQRRRRELAAVLAFEQAARRDGIAMLDAHAAAIARGERLAAPGLVAELAAQWNEYRRRAHVVDDADIIGGRLYPDPQCPLVLVTAGDEIGAPGQQALANLFPASGLIVAGAPGQGMLARLKPQARIILEP